MNFTDKYLDVDLNVDPSDQPECSYRCRRCKRKRAEGTASDPLIINEHNDDDNSFCRCKEQAGEIQRQGGVGVRENAIAAENAGRASNTPRRRARIRTGPRIIRGPSRQAQQTSVVTNPDTTPGEDPAPTATRTRIRMREFQVICEPEIYKRIGVYTYRGMSYSTSEEDGGTCCICLKDYEINVSQIGFLECGHEFDYDCIKSGSKEEIAALFAEGQVYNL